MNSATTLLIVLIGLGTGLHVGMGATATVRPASDTTLFEKFPGANLGAASTIVAGTVNTGQRSRSLIQFNVAGVIPVGAVINTVTLTLRTVDQPPGAISSTFDLRRVLQAWGEGAKNNRIGSPASIGEATWNHRSFSLQPWAAPGGASGTDFSTVLSASKSISGLGAFTFASNPQLVADVQSWLDNPANNFGWMLSSESEATRKTAKRFGSREDVVNAPTLSIVYTPVPEPSTGALLLLGGIFWFWRRRAGAAPIRS